VETVALINRGMMGPAKSPTLDRISQRGHVAHGTTIAEAKAARAGSGAKLNSMESWPIRHRHMTTVGQVGGGRDRGLPAGSSDHSTNIEIKGLRGHWPVRQEIHFSGDKNEFLPRATGFG